jgi:hypothetical protein
MKRNQLAIVILFAMAGLAFGGGTTEEIDSLGASEEPTNEEIEFLGKSEEGGRLLTHIGFTVAIDRDVLGEGVQTAFLALEEPPESPLGVIGVLSVDREAVDFEELIPVVNLDIWVEDGSDRHTLADLDTRETPAPHVTASVDFAEVNKALYEHRISEESELYFEFVRGTLFSLAAGETLGLIRVTKKPSAADQTLEFEVFKWRVDDLMIYINDR